MPKNWDGIISQLINRRISRPIARFLSKYKSVTPNHITIISFLFCIFSSLAFILFQPLIGGILAQVSSILDGVDGDLAILTNRTTKFGSFLDSTLDRYGDILIIIGMTYYAFMLFPDILTVFFGILAISGSLMVSYSRAKAESSLNLIFKSGVAGLAGNRDVRLFIIMIGGILNQIFITLIILSVLTNIVVVLRIIIATRNYSSDENKQPT